jgi:hypothetical protein
MSQSKQIRGNTLSAEQVLETFAHIINYLNVSLYEGQFTYKHEQARARINALYDEVANKVDVFKNENNFENTTTTPPFANECGELYSNLMCLWNVTDTDDPDYHNYIHKIINHHQSNRKV